MKLNQEILKGLSEAVGDKLPTVFEFNKKIGSKLEELDDLLEGDFSRIEEVFEGGKKFNQDTFELDYNIYIKGHVDTPDKATVVIMGLSEAFDLTSRDDINKLEKELERIIKIFRKQN